MTRPIPLLVSPAEKKALLDALSEAEHRPWIVAEEDVAMENWILAFGTDAQTGKAWALTTHNLRASEVRGNGPKEDATACALAVNAAERLLEENRLLRKLIATLLQEEPDEDQGRLFGGHGSQEG